MTEQYTLYNFYRQSRSSQLFCLQDLTPGQQKYLKDWAYYFFEVWISHADFRISASYEKINKALLPYYPEDEMVNANLSEISTVINLWVVFGFGVKRTSDRAQKLTNQIGLYSRQTKRMFDSDFEAYIDTIIKSDNPELLDPTLYVGKSQRMVSEELSIPPRVVKRLFAHLVSTGRFKVKLMKVAGTAIRALVEV